MTADAGHKAASRVDLTSDAAQARLRGRHRAETRFKAYGIFALLLTCLFVVVVIADVLRRGMPAFLAHSLVLEVTVPVDAVPADRRSDPQAIKGIDFYPITRDLMRQTIPGIEGRAQVRTLTRLLSTGAADTLADTLAGKPELLGQPVRTRLLLSSQSDLYLKGNETAVSSRADTRGTATASATTGDVTIQLSVNDLTEEFVAAKRILSARAEQILQDAERIERRNGLSEQVKTMRVEAEALKARFDQPGTMEVLDDKMPSLLLAINGGVVKLTGISNVSATGVALLPLKTTDPASPGSWKVLTYHKPESTRKVSDLEVTFLERLRELGKVESHFNTRFFTAGDSREPELAGIRGAFSGTVLTLAVTLVLALFFGVMAAVYLEEFAPRNWFTEMIEINVNNLAAVPSIVFGLLGLAVFLNFFSLPRSAPLVGGLVLALLVLPTIIVASRAALKAVPPSIREAALGIGASQQQAVFHHVLPLAMPGIMTGTIIGMAHALGETAPLLMIGMVAFIVDVPQSFTQAATVLPVQIYLWSDLPEIAFQAKTAGAIIVLLLFLFGMNGLAIYLRKKFERRW